MVGLQPVPKYNFMKTTIYYNAIVITPTGKRIRYNDITRPDAFAQYANNQLGAKVIYFYKKWFRESPDGQYCGYWSINGFSFAF